MDSSRGIHAGFGIDGRCSLLLTQIIYNLLPFQRFVFLRANLLAQELDCLLYVLSHNFALVKVQYLGVDKESQFLSHYPRMGIVKSYVVPRILCARKTTAMSCSFVTLG